MKPIKLAALIAAVVIACVGAVPACGGDFGVFDGPYLGDDATAPDAQDGQDAGADASGRDAPVADSVVDQSSPDGKLDANDRGDAKDANDGAATDSEADAATDADAADANDGAAGDAEQSGPDGDGGSMEDASDSSALDASDASDGATMADGGDGGPVLYMVGGTVQGLAAGETLLLVDNGVDMRFVNTNGTFSFNVALMNGAPYAVTIGGQPMSETCMVSLASGVIAGANVTNVAVVCAITTHTLGGTVTGYDGTGLQLDDSLGMITVPQGATTFTFGSLPVGTMYSITLVTEPTGPNDSCSITAGATGTIGSMNVNDVQVTCIPTPACAPACSDGASCGDDSDCGSLICMGGTCQPPACAPAPHCPGGNPCGANGDCISNACMGGKCQLGGAGASCGANTDCLSDDCAANKCQKGGDGAGCGTGADCLTNVCTGGRCQPPACSPMCGGGATCGANADCLSVVCTAGSCALGNDGASCARNADCFSDVCTGGKCQLGAAGAGCGANGDCLSDVCTAGTCALGDDGAACNHGTDCGSNRCSGVGGMCRPPVCSPNCSKNAACGANSDCKNGQCNDFQCN